VLAFLDWLIVRLAVPVAVVTIGALCYIFTSESVARLVLHVVSDVVNHFYRPAEDFPVRQQIEARFHKVFARLVKEERPQRLTVIAHSQGTVIAFDALAKIGSQDWFQPYAKQLRMDMVTVGSPLTHLYQHYFPSHYPPRDDPRWSTLSKTIPCWYNIFRVDDYVGTFIRKGSDTAQAQGWPQNIPARPGGHTNYWAPDIFRHLKDVTPSANRNTPLNDRQ
jgi:hypothetical protein